MTSFRNKIFAKVIKDLEITLIRVALNMMPGIPIRKGENTETHRERAHLKTEAAIGVMLIKAKKYQRLLSATKSLEEARKDSILESSDGA